MNLGLMPGRLAVIVDGPAYQASSKIMSIVADIPATLTGPPDKTSIYSVPSIEVI